MLQLAKDSYQARCKRTVGSRENIQMAPGVLKSRTEDYLSDDGLGSASEYSPERSSIHVEPNFRQPIAIIGLSLKFPGDATSTESF